MTQAELGDKSIAAIRILSAVFSKNRKVAANRIAILRFVNSSEKGRLAFTDILKNVQSTTDEFYNSQRLAYDLRILKENLLVDQMASADYTITSYGYFVLDVFGKIAAELHSPQTEERPGFVGRASGFISKDHFDQSDLARFEEALSQLHFFKRIPSYDEARVCVAWRDDANLTSEIEIMSDGRFTIEIILFVNLPKPQGAFREDLENTSIWHENAKGLVQTILYYLQKTVSKLWENAQVVVTIGPDSYPINVYTGITGV
jgi:hypothetical protein